MKMVCDGIWISRYNERQTQTHKIRTSALIINDSGMHIFPCKGGGEGSVAGRINGVRHNVTNSAVELAYKRYIMQGLDGVTPASAYPSAHVYTVGFGLWF